MLTTLLTLCLITFVADITPGPNFWKIVHYSVFHSYADAFRFITGLLTSSVLHCLMGFIGISALIATFSNALLLIQIIGGIYIAWYGLRMLRTRKTEDARGTTAEQQPAVALDMAAGHSRLWLDGVLTNFSNPKTVLFYASLFAVTLTPDLPTTSIAVLVVSLLATSFATNILVATLFALQPIRRFFRRWQQIICRMIGGMLIVAGFGIIFQQRG